jgi:hypothetical protein
MIEAPKLLVEWSSPWQEFVSSIGPALGKSPARLAGEAQTGLFPFRGMLLSWGLQAVFLAALIWIPAKLATMRPYVPPTPPKYDVIYFSADELPQVADRGGAQAGQSGRAGGQEAFHHSQTIRVARGNRATEKVVDAPDLKLPISADPVKNLLAFKPVPGPPPAEGIQRSVAAPSLSKNAIVAPPPAVIRELDRDTPRLGSSVIAPPPSNLSADKVRQTMGLTPVIIEPAAKDVPRDQSHSLVAMNSPIIQPAPSDVQRQPPPLRGPSAATTMIVPPPVSSPVREAVQNPKLTMPAPSVIAPPPSQVDREQRTVSGVALADPKVVPPPVQLGERSQDRQAIIGPAGADRIVPPPPSVAGGSALTGGGRGHSDKAGGVGTMLADNIVPPPPSVSGDGSRTGMGRGPGDPSGSLGGIPGANAVVPPPPSVGSASGSPSGRGTGSLGTPTVVPPPPTISGGTGSPTGRGMGSKGGGIGGAFDNGSVLAPPTTAGGSIAGKGVVVSPQPGSKEGLPGNGSAGSLAMSPSGGSKAGLGGSGGGEGIGHGNGPGSGLSGEGSGAAKAGTGRGSDPNARGGTSPYPGTGGAGSGTKGQPAMPGASVQGGSTGVVNLPSFGSNESEPTFPGRSSAGAGQNDLDITVEATLRSGGGFAFYEKLPGDKKLRGDKIYTKYIRTVDGPVVMQFSDPSSASHSYGVELTAPTPLRTDLPANATKRSRIVIACILDRTGSLKNLQVLDAGAGTSRVMAALSSWKFSPAMRGAEPIEVNAIIGFNIDTRQ